MKVTANHAYGVPTVLTKDMAHSSMFNVDRRIIQRLVEQGLIPILSREVKGDIYDDVPVEITRIIHAKWTQGDTFEDVVVRAQPEIQAWMDKFRASTPEWRSPLAKMVPRTTTT